VLNGHVLQQLQGGDAGHHLTMEVAKDDTANKWRKKEWVSFENVRSRSGLVVIPLPRTITNAKFCALFVHALEGTRKGAPAPNGRGVMATSVTLVRMYVRLSSAKVHVQIALGKQDSTSTFSKQGATFQTRVDLDGSLVLHLVLHCCQRARASGSGERPQPLRGAQQDSRSHFVQIALFGVVRGEQSHLFRVHIGQVLNNALSATRVSPCTRTGNCKARGTI
jgi:hypothetical protein